jgi:predicted permease
MSGLLNDLRLAWRSLHAAPVVTLVAVVSLALGIGTCTGIFSVLNSMALRPLPVADPGRLVTITSNTALGLGFQAGAGWSNAMWERLRDRGGIFDGAFAWMLQRLDSTQSGEMHPVDVLFASGDVFDVLGVPAIRGRTFTTDDDARGGGPDGAVGVISHEFWQRRFNGAETVLGSAFTVEGVRVTIIGVTPPAFFGVDVGQRFDVAVPLGAEVLIRGPQALVNNPRALLLTVMLRLRPDRTAVEATSALRAMQPDIVGPDAAAFLEEPFVLAPASRGISDRSSLRQRYERPLLLISMGGGLVLLVVCVNIANVLSARTAARRREVSVRVALGAPRWRLAREFLVESTLIGAMGAMLGLAVATITGRILVSQLQPGPAPLVLAVAIDWRVLAFTVAVTLAAVAVFGTAPALSRSRVRPLEALQEAGRNAGGRKSLSGMLIAVQVAVSIVLLMAAGLLVATLSRLTNVPLGFDPDRLLVMTVNTANVAVDADARLLLYEAIVDRVRAVPGVVMAAGSHWTPIGGGGGVLSDARGRRADVGARQVAFNFVTPGWFATYRTALEAGRDFTAADHAGAPRVAVVNQALRRSLFAERNPIGATLEAGPCGKSGCTVIGVVADAIYGRSLRDAAPPTVYVPVAQSAGLVPPNSRAVRVTLRTAGDPSAAVPSLSTALRRVDPSLTFTFQPLASDVAVAFAQERLVALLAAIFGLVALLLSAIGLYGVVAYSVTQRRPEIGIRLALGALPRGVVLHTLSRVATPVGFGVGAGVAASLWLSQFVAPLLYGIEPRDPVTALVATSMLVATGAIAAWVPASRAAAIDPAEVLRAL